MARSARSEIRDGGINVADVSTTAQTALRGELRLAADDNDSFEDLPTCTTQELADCADHLVLQLRADAPPVRALRKLTASRPVRGRACEPASELCCD